MQQTAAAMLVHREFNGHSAAAAADLDCSVAAAP
jgi:hypothetical protein